VRGFFKIAGLLGVAAEPLLIGFGLRRGRNGLGSFEREAAGPQKTPKDTTLAARMAANTRMNFMALSSCVQ